MCRLILPFCVISLAHGAEPESWKGQSVLPIRAYAELTAREKPDGKPLSKYEFAARYPINIREQKGEQWRIHDGRREVWVLQSEWVRSIDAPVHFTKVLKLQPKNALAFYLRGQAWFDRGEYDAAYLDFNEAIRLEAGNARFHVARAHAGIEAILGVKPLGLKFPEQSDNITKERKEHLPLVKQDFVAALRADPSDAYVFFVRGVATNRWVNFYGFTESDGIDNFTEAIRLDSGYAEAYLRRAGELSPYNLKSWDAPVKDIMRALKVDPGATEAHFQLGMVYKEKHAEKFLACMHDVLRLDPGHRKALEQVALHHGQNVDLGDDEARRAINAYTALLNITRRIATSC
jgi:tetratricopeptide (TPR) repeat protein